MLMPSVFGKDLFDDFFDFPFYDNNEMDKLEKKLYGHRSKNLMKTDVQESDDSYIMEMDLPGFSKDDVKVSLNLLASKRPLITELADKLRLKYPLRSSGGPVR